MSHRSFLSAIVFLTVVFIITMGISFIFKLFGWI